MGLILKNEQIHERCILVQNIHLLIRGQSIQVFLELLIEGAESPLAFSFSEDFDVVLPLTIIS